MEKKIEKEDAGETRRQSEKYSLKEIEKGWRDYLNKTPEEREKLKDPFQYKHRDLHLNQCLQVIPDQFREQVKHAKQDSEEDSEVTGDYQLQLRLFLASDRPRYPTMKNNSTWI